MKTGMSYIDLSWGSNSWMKAREWSGNAILPRRHAGLTLFIKLYSGFVITNCPVSVGLLSEVPKLSGEKFVASGPFRRQGNKSQILTRWGCAAQDLLRSGGPKDGLKSWFIHVRAIHSWFLTSFLTGRGRLAGCVWMMVVYKSWRSYSEWSRGCGYGIIILSSNWRLRI